MSGSGKFAARQGRCRAALERQITTANFLPERRLDRAFFVGEFDQHGFEFAQELSQRRLAGTVGYISSVELPFATLAAVLALTIEIVGGIALIVGFGTRPAALVLALFTLVASCFFHAYWSVPADQQQMQQLLFFKNAGVVGGLLTLAAWGAGAWSIDARRNA